MISWASGAPSAGGAGSGAEFRSVAEEDEEEALLCKLGGAGTAEDVVVTFGLLCRSDGDVAAVGRARSGERAASPREESKKGKAKAILLRRRAGALPPFPFIDAVACATTPFLAEPDVRGVANDFSAAADAESTALAGASAAREGPTAAVEDEGCFLSGESRIFVWTFPLCFFPAT